MLVIESCVGINDGIKPRIGIIKLFKTMGYRTYSDGVGATTRWVQWSKNIAKGHCRAGIKTHPVQFLESNLSSNNLFSSLATIL